MCITWNVVPICMSGYGIELFLWSIRKKPEFHILSVWILWTTWPLWLMCYKKWKQRKICLFGQPGFAILPLPYLKTVDFQVSLQLLLYCSCSDHVTSSYLGRTATHPEAPKLRMATHMRKSRSMEQRAMVMRMRRGQRGSPCLACQAGGCHPDEVAVMPTAVVRCHLAPNLSMCPLNNVAIYLSYLPCRHNTRRSLCKWQWMTNHVWNNTRITNINISAL